jgi:diguanylate cyclase (GGDEF)-like protein
MPAPFDAALEEVPLAVLDATRALLRVSTAAEARRIAEDLVLALGGALVASSAEGADVIPADLSFGHGDPVLAAAPPGSRGRLRLDRYLSPYLLDARHALELSVRTERLSESASTDVLTGLPNRRMIDRALGRLAEGDTVIILDLDHFKRVNDELGHAAGDDVLRAFGGVLSRTARGRDVVGRFGGEEFVAVLLTPAAGAEAFLQRLRTAWIDERPIPVTFSAGVARSKGDPDATIRLADQALYAAKDGGRDQWCTATDLESSAKAEPRDSLQPYLADAVLGRRQPAIRLAIDLLDNRVRSDTIVEKLLAAAQREVGDRWQRNELTAADEHLATGVAAAALDALSGEAALPSARGLTVVTCAEGDWHSLAAQMFGESLRMHGIGVKVLGASTPPDAVADFLGRSGGDSLAISCSLPVFFHGAARLADAAHQRGVPVIMGGRAFGADPLLAARLGADAWAPGAAEAADILTSWAAHPPQIDATPTALDPAALRLAASAERLGAAAFADLASHYSALNDYDERQLISTRQDLVFMAQYLAAAMLVDEPAVFTDYLGWLEQTLGYRGVPRRAVLAGLEALRPHVAAIEPVAARLIDNCLQPT